MFARPTGHTSTDPLLPYSTYIRSRPPLASRPLLRPRHMGGADPRFAVARRLARRPCLDRQPRAGRPRDLDAKSGGVAARDRLSRRAPARPCDPDARRRARGAASEPQDQQFPGAMADRRRGRIGPDRLSHLPPPAPQIYAAAGRPRPVAVETLSDDARQPVAQGAARPDRPDLFQTARSAEHTSELHSLMRISYDVFALKKKHSNTTK